MNGREALLFENVLMIIFRRWDISVDAFRRWLVMMCLCMSGGIIFWLPFLSEIFYKPLQEALGLDNTQYGKMISIFGISSLICYFPGGWLADRVSPRKLITISCIVTGLSGFYFTKLPSYNIACAIHAFWGVSTVLTFWGAMIKATRNWAPANRQGKAFGILEAGRGLAEAVSATIALGLFALLGEGIRGVTGAIVMFSGLNILIGVMIWFVLDDSAQPSAEKKERVKLFDIIKAMKIPAVWLIAIVIITAYSAYWGLYYYTPYAQDVFGMTAVMAGAIGAGKMWLKPIPATAAGLLADKLGSSKAVAYSFLILIVCYIVSALLPGDPKYIAVMLFAIILASAAVFASRGIYFALLEEGSIPLALTGTATGIISVIGYTPDIFMPILGGFVRDKYPEKGYTYLFLFITAMCTLGLLASLMIMRQSVNQKRKTDDSRNNSIASNKND